MIRPLGHTFSRVARRLSRLGLASLACGLLLAVMYDAGAPGLPQASELATPDPRPSLCLSTNPSFRLGNAARPLGWSTAIADFNVDGAPDIAVADRIARGAAGYSYRIQLSISGEQTDAVTFESATDAIQLRVSDVDADNDLDLVASAVLSKDIVGVWLNDGHGRFTSSDVRQLPAAIGARQALDLSVPSSDPASFDDSPRHSDGAAAMLLRGPPPRVPRGRFATIDTSRGFSVSRVSAAAPRAPPTPAFRIS